MSPSARTRTEIANLRYDLAALTVEIKIIRAMRTLSRTYQSDQPRAPAGQSDRLEADPADLSGDAPDDPALNGQANDPSARRILLIETRPRVIQ